MIFRSGLERTVIFMLNVRYLFIYRWLLATAGAIYLLTSGLSKAKHGNFSITFRPILDTIQRHL